MVIINGLSLESSRLLVGVKKKHRTPNGKPRENTFFGASLILRQPQIGLTNRCSRLGPKPHTPTRPLAWGLL